MKRDWIIQSGCVEIEKKCLKSLKFEGSCLKGSTLRVVAITD